LRCNKPKAGRAKKKSYSSRTEIIRGTIGEKDHKRKIIIMIRRIRRKGPKQRTSEYKVGQHGEEKKSADDNGSGDLI